MGVKNCSSFVLTAMEDVLCTLWLCCCFLTFQFVLHLHEKSKNKPIPPSSPSLSHSAQEVVLLFILNTCFLFHTFPFRLAAHNSIFFPILRSSRWIMLLSSPQFPFVLRWSHYVILNLRFIIVHNNTPIISSRVTKLPTMPFLCVNSVRLKMDFLGSKLWLWLQGLSHL